MEKTPNAAVVPSPITWSDLGSWDAIWKLAGGDENGNVVSGNATVSDTTNSLVMSRNAHLAVQGMDGVAVVASEDAVYVGRSTGPRMSATSSSCSPPQGNGASDREPPHGTAPLGRLYINPQRRPLPGETPLRPPGKEALPSEAPSPRRTLGLRARTAEVTIDDTVTVLHENQSIYIPQGSVHRLANPGKIRLEVIEVQTVPISARMISFASWTNSAAVEDHKIPSRDP